MHKSVIKSIEKEIKEKTKKIRRLRGEVGLLDKEINNLRKALSLRTVQK